MSCNHKREWEMRWVVNGGEVRFEDLLKDGWEPYAVAPITKETWETHYFKRQKLCEECPKELQMQQEVMAQLQKEEAERVRKFDSYAKQKMIKSGRLY